MDVSAADVRACVLTGLQDHLYTNFYSQAAALPAFDGQDETTPRARIAAFVQQLSEANQGRGYLEPGWEVDRHHGPILFVRRSGFEVRARMEDVVAAEADAPLLHAAVGLRLPKEFVGRAPGYYVAMGNAWLPDGNWANVVRIYWNVTFEGAIALMTALTSGLNDAGVPFQFKVLTKLARVTRCDAAVLYLRRSDYAHARGVLQHVHASMAGGLRTAGPAFTKPLAPGVALAEDPGNGFSFGEHRCRLLAEALIRAHEQRRRSLKGRLAVVLERLEEERIDPERPYLNPDSEDAYEFERRDWSPHKSSAAERPHQPAVTTRDQDLLDTADRIGDQLCRDAVWSDGRCTWVATSVDDRGRVGCGAAGPALYAGTSGVAWFLGELYAVTGSAAARSTSLGAIDHALHRAEHIAPINRSGLFTGWVGIGLAATHVALATGDGALLQRAHDLLRQIEPPPAGTAELDQITGAAGSITGLIALHEILGDRYLLDAAAAHGETLLARARRTRHHWSWSTTNTARQVNLTGWSHGAAGIACALVDLFRVTRDERFRDAAQRGFAYEQYWFQKHDRNWPDLRGYPSSGLRRTDRLTCGSVWCHGAPGIALSRLRAYEVLADPDLRADALLAFRTTHALTESAFRNKTMNFSLCHGLAGNAEILQMGSEAFDAEFPEGALLAQQITASGIERHGRGNTPWPCGAAGPTPSLMVGFAGMGYFYLRRSQTDLPSVLLLNRQGDGERSGHHDARNPDSVPSAGAHDRGARQSEPAALFGRDEEQPRLRTPRRDRGVDWRLPAL
jgi:hypothetical protein